MAAFTFFVGGEEAKSIPYYFFSLSLSQKSRSLSRLSLLELLQKNVLLFLTACPLKACFYRKCLRVFWRVIDNIILDISWSSPQSTRR
jgi:hypothetical protein